MAGRGPAPLLQRPARPFTKFGKTTGKLKHALPMYVELHARSAFSFLEGASVPEELAGACAQFGMPAMALVDRNGVYGAPRFHMAAKKAGVRAHVGSEITCTNGLTYPLLVETREGYRNLCRLVTRMKLRAPKARAPPRWMRSPNSRAASSASRAIPMSACSKFSAARNLYAELQRHYHREEEARNQEIVERARRLGIPLVATNGVGLRHARPARVARRVHLRSQQSDAGQRRPAAGAQLRAPRQNARRNGAPVRRPARSHRQHARNLLAPGIHARRSGLRISALSRARRRNHDELSARARGGRRAPPLPAVPRARAAADRARAGADRKAQAGRLFPDRLGHRALLPRKRHPGAGPRLGRQQRGLLRARNHRGRPGRHGPAVRALPFRRARRMARHRYRPAQRRHSASAPSSTSTSASESWARP